MNIKRFIQITSDGIWHNNAGVVQLLGLCPLLGVSATAVNGIGLGLATICVLIISNLAVSMLRNIVPPQIRIPVFIIIIATAVTIIELLMQAFLYNLYTVLGIFLPLITTNCAIIGRAEGFAAKNPVFDALIDALAVGIGFLLVLFLLGAMRELIGQGTLFSGAELLFGNKASSWQLQFSTDYRGFLLAVLPPGAFIGMGLMVACKNIIDAKYNAK